MAGSGFGEHLKREREMRGVSLDEIASATRISVRLLAALEQESWDRLPGGVFNRGFVRTIARYLGLEEDGLLAEYSLASGEKNAPPPIPAELPKQPAKEKRGTLWLAIAVVPVALGLGVGAWFGWQWYEGRRTEWTAAESAVPTRPAPPPVPTAPEPNASESPNRPPDPQVLAKSAQELQLKIDAIKDVSLVVSADGLDAFTGTLPMGQSRTVTAQNTLTIEAQDAGAVRLELNGQTLAPMGPAGQPGRLMLDHSSVSDSAGGHD